MKLGLLVLAGSAISSLAIVALLGGEATLNLRLAVLLGMLAPLVATLCSMAVFSRAYRREPASLTRVMIGAFVAKVLFFGGYVMLVVKAGWVQPTPFAISFVSYFFALHIVEAFRLRRLVTTT